MSTPLPAELAAIDFTPDPVLCDCCSENPSCGTAAAEGAPQTARYRLTATPQYPCGCATQGRPVLLCLGCAATSTASQRFVACPRHRNVIVAFALMFRVEPLVVGGCG